MNSESVKYLGPKAWEGYTDTEKKESYPQTNLNWLSKSGNQYFVCVDYVKFS